MSETAGMRALLDLEDSGADELRESVPGTDIPLWPLARWPVSRALAEADIGTTVPTYPTPPALHRLQASIRRALPNPHSSRRIARADHLFVVSGWTKSTGTTGFKNWLSDDFAESLGDDAVVLQDAPLDRLSRGQLRPANPRTWSFAGQLRAVTRDATSAPLSASAEKSLRDTLARIFSLLAHPTTEVGRQRAVDDVVGRAARAEFARRRFRSVLDRVRPRRIYMQTAAYGTRAPEILLARSLGVEVVELQHGWMGSSHAAYNVGAVMREGDLRRCLPQTVLGYGEFWGRDIRLPSEFVAVGKPTLDPARLQSPSWNSRPRRLLFVGSNFAPDVVEHVLLELADALPQDWSLVLRPHPVERRDASVRYARALRHPRIALDEIPDAELSLASSRAVVGFSSTMLFEALAFGCHVAVVESALADHYAAADIFPTRIAEDGSDASSCADRFTAAPDDADRTLTESVWKSDAVANFLRFAGR